MLAPFQSAYFEHRSRWNPLTCSCGNHLEAHPIVVYCMIELENGAGIWENGVGDKKVCIRQSQTHS